jgi:hypothetical protein
VAEIEIEMLGGEMIKFMVQTLEKLKQKSISSKKMFGESARSKQS